MSGVKWMPGRRSWLLLFGVRSWITLLLQQLLCGMVGRIVSLKTFWGMSMRNLFLVFAIVAPHLAGASPGAGEAVCAVKDGRFELDMGRNKPPTHAAVVLPDGNLLRLRYLAVGIDTLGEQYSRGRVSIRLHDLMGFDGDARRVPVFGRSGVYRFIMRDANTAEGMDIHQLQCQVTLAESQLGSGAK